MKKYLVLVVLLLSCSSAFAWDDGGHMLVARIAYSQLSANARKQSIALLKYLPDERKSTHAAKPRAYDFISAACWMDDVRSVKKYERLKSWHYIDVPCGGVPRAVKTPNALSALEYSTLVLKSNLYSQSGRALALAILIHTTGDIHQPLHCMDKDLGGNTFPILGVPNLRFGLRSDGKLVDEKLPEIGDNAPVYQRLHAFWDSAYRYDVSTKSVQPLAYLGDSAHPDLARIKAVAEDLTTHYFPTDSKVLAEPNAANWVRESNEIACDFAFKTPRKRTPSLTYFERAHDLSCQRIALAGYRLAHLLNEIFAGS